MQKRNDKRTHHIATTTDSDSDIDIEIGYSDDPNCDTKKSSSEEQSLAISEDDYGCEHYKRKSKFVVSL